MSLCTLVETNVNKFAISNHAAFKLHVQALRSFPRLIINMSFISYQIEKLLLQKIIGQKLHEEQASPGPPSFA